MAKVLMKGNEAVAKAAIEAGCKYFFGYPITPQNEIPEYMAREMPKVGGVFLQAESEVAAINMVYGAAGAGARVMTSSSSPGIALKQEGIEARPVWKPMHQQPLLCKVPAYLNGKSDIQVTPGEF